MKRISENGTEGTETRKGTGTGKTELNRTEPKKEPVL